MQEHSTGLRAYPTPDFPSNTFDLAGLEPAETPCASDAQHAAQGVAEGDALKLDTRILEGNPLQDITKPAILPYDDEAYLNRSINYPVYEHRWSFRAKIQEFSAGGFEVVINSINMQKISDMAAAGITRGPRIVRKGDAEAQEKARRRARKMVRQKCKEMGADHLLTLTTRATLTRDELRKAFARFTDNLRYHLGVNLEYVCVVERHPTNPDHLHLHLAIRGRLSARQMVIFRRCWYVALGGKGNAKGADVPGGFNVRQIRVSGGAHRRMDKIASYISKYITKASCAGFNQKNYWASKINLMAVRTYWLKARTIKDALVEFCKEFDFFPTDPKQDYFAARNIDLIWMRCVPEPREVVTCPF